MYALVERADDFALLVVELLLKLHRDALLVRIGANLAHFRVVLSVELRLIRRQLLIRVEEDRQIRNVGLIDESHVRQVGGDGPGRQADRYQRCRSQDYP